MVSFRSFFAAAVSVALAFAQTPNIAFTSVPAVAVAGNNYNITWGGGDGTSITLTLRRGNPNNLDTVNIIASRVTGTSYLWNVPTNLETASDYALQIQQGVNGINYSGLFSIVGGTGSSSISYSGLSTATMNGTTITTGVIMTRTSDISMGTGTTMIRNATFSSQSLSATARSTSTSSSATRAATTITQQTNAPSGNAAASMGSSVAMVMGLFGAIMFLQ